MSDKLTVTTIQGVDHQVRADRWYVDEDGVLHLTQGEAAAAAFARGQWVGVQK